MMAKNLSIVFALVLMAFNVPANAGAKYLKDGFSFSKEPKPSVLVVPKLFVGTLDGQNQEIENSEWLEKSHINLRQSLINNRVSERVQLIMQDWNGPASQTLSEKFWLNVDHIATDILFKVPLGTFPIADYTPKKLNDIKKGYYSYKLSSEMLTEIKKNQGDADFALLVKMHDAYTNTDAKFRRFLSGVGNVISDGVNTQALPPHNGKTILLDLSDGSIVWMYMDGAFGGDLRKEQYAPKRVKQMLTRFPAP
ncbi:hypothetical protein [Parasphingorhabdus sp.]|uniref:hypothetical protein n=1 Tax=Parasphingorhabdus sp. TaxID=2709688 RepID=UPI0039E2EDD0